MIYEKDSGTECVEMVNGESRYRDKYLYRIVGKHQIFISTIPSGVVCDRETTIPVKWEGKKLVNSTWDEWDKEHKTKEKTDDDDLLILGLK